MVTMKKPDTSKDYDKDIKDIWAYLKKLYAALNEESMARARDESSATVSAAIVGGDARYLMLDQTTPQTVTAGWPVFDGIDVSGLYVRGLEEIHVDGSSALAVRSADSNYSQLSLGINTSSVYSYIQTNHQGSGTTLPLTIWLDSTERARFNTDGTVKLNAYTTNGLVTFTGSNGTLGVDTSTYLTPSSLVSAIYGKTQAINDDAAFSFTPATASGILIVNDPDHWGCVAQAYYMAASGYANIASIYTGSDTNLTTGVLSGTTGTDAKLTISVHTDQKVYVENRIGTAITIRYMTLDN
jgi:hypothetical protein